MRQNVIYIILSFVTFAWLSLVVLSCVRASDVDNLCIAAEQGNIQQVKYFVERGTPVNQRMSNGFGFTPLIAAIFHDNTNIVYYLIQVGVDVNVTDDRGKSALMWQIGWGDSRADMVKLLLTHGAFVLAKDKDGVSVLDYAQSEPAKPQIVALLRSALTRTNIQINR